jgi:DNA-binding NarL/FixJ family response regulator
MASIPATETTYDALPPEQSRRTIVALALRDEAVATTIAAGLTAEHDATALTCRSADPLRLAAWLYDHRPDVLLLDERWLRRFGAAPAPSVRRACPNLRVLLVGERASAALAEQVIRRRFDGLLLAKEAADAAGHAVRAIMRGEMWMPRALLVRLLLEHVPALGHRPREAAAAGKLTRREAEVVAYVRRGFANKHIADSLAIREDTVKKHLRNAYTKLGVHRRSELIVSP